MFLRRAATILRNIGKKDEYVEKYKLVKGLKKDNLGGFGRLVRSYKDVPMVMDRVRYDATE